MYAKQTHLVLDLLTIRHLTAVLADLDVLLTEVGVLGPRGLEEGRVGVHDQVDLRQAQISVSGVQRLYKQTEHRAGVSDASKAWERGTRRLVLLSHGGPSLHDERPVVSVRVRLN